MEKFHLQCGGNMKKGKSKFNVTQCYYNPALCNKSFFHTRFQLNHNVIVFKNEITKPKYHLEIYSCDFVLTET